LIEALPAGLVALALSSLAFTLWLGRDVERRFPAIGHLVNFGSGRLHVVETAPKGPARGAVVLVHGASGNFADPHVALAGRLADEGFRVFAVDRPGHGWSDRLAGRAASSPPLQAAWIVRALTALGVAEATVVVHSLSGVLGLAMALDAPDFTRALVLLAPVSHPWRGGVSWYYTAAALPGLGALFRWLVVPLAGLATMGGALAEVFAPNAVPPDYARRTRLPLVLRPRHFRANAEDFVALCGEARALAPRYGEIAAPTVIVMGAEDNLVSADVHARRLERDIPGAILRMLPGIGHSPHFAAPDAVVAAVLDAEESARRAGAPQEAAAQ
jgi:pimeloyl-ACP methyl ester carboxylesterase